MKQHRADSLAKLQKIYFFLDQPFAKEKEKIAYLYSQLLNKKIYFVETVEEAHVVVNSSSDWKASFVLEVTETVMIKAKCPLAAFRATMYLAKLLKTDAEIKPGTFHDDLAERIIMLDIGRKYFSPSGLRLILEQMALYGFNYLQLHFSENTGFRIESVNYPELVSEKFLTTTEVKELIRYAEYLSIEIIPDIDTPGHMEHLLKESPDWQLSIENMYGEIHKVPSALDITNEKAVAFALSLYQEYMLLFAGSRYFHIGGDEFVDFDQIKQYPALADEGIKKFEAYVNTVANFVKGHGFIPRVWNDAFFRRGKSSTLTKEVEITYWTKWQKQMAPVQTFVDEGYSVINFNDNYLYYVLGENAGYTYPTIEKIKQEWRPDLFASQQQIPTEQQSKIKGAALAVWCDNPETKDEKEIITDLVKLMEGLSFHLYNV
ncbi:family 20 glycosylhydrolase [Enterococcus ureasiticus]|uniref:family 20 glycosylhydrolase n=1 Tax=Enterococcus ureasiticus TaxID=903984 RepID=UPI001A90A957|nr:family 20 glycosylhydrolase [Enterococcus ureasiticus]MBO0472121.1 family 20 glycosylhydrolase [Enterococcus ureasiticus]